MNMPTKFVVVLLAVGACVRSDAAEEEPHALASKASTPVAPVAARGLLEPGELHAIATVRVQGRTGPGNAPFDVALRTLPAQLGQSRRFGQRTLDISLRTGPRDLSQFPCTSCHAGRALIAQPGRLADAHTSTPAEHPRETGAKCSTCHAIQDVSLLTLQSGEAVPLDHAYRVCAQCHTPQLEAWSNGAHGKRLDGWQGRRVVMNCTDCHDPHAPRLQPRIPFRPPRLQRVEK